MQWQTSRLKPSLRTLNYAGSMPQPSVSGCRWPQQRGVELGQFTAVKPAWMPAILSLPNWLFLRLAKAMLDIDPHARSSMWEDISQGRKN